MFEIWHLAKQAAAAGRLFGAVVPRRHAAGPLDPADAALITLQVHRSQIMNTIPHAAQ